MKRLEISRLMDEYVDNEFFPAGGSVVDSEAVKDKVIAKAAPARKRRVPVRGMLLAAALAAALIATAVAVPFMEFSLSTLFTDGEPNIKVVNGVYGVYGNVEGFTEDFLVLEDGRIWLLLNGERTDITDWIDEDTPYIINYTDPETGLKSSLILGGTPEDFGWQLWTEEADGLGYSGAGYNDATEYYTIDGVTYASKRGDHSIDNLLFGHEYEDYELVYKPWAEKGRQEAEVFGWDR